jgi:hypothetical protein
MLDAFEGFLHAPAAVVERAEFGGRIAAVEHQQVVSGDQIVQGLEQHLPLAAVDWLQACVEHEIERVSDD